MTGPMTQESINQLIDSVAEELLMADPSNLQDLGKILDCFQKIQQEAHEEGLIRAADAAEAAGSLVRCMILDEVSDREETFDVISQTVSALQQMMRPGVDAENIFFPEKLPLSAAAKNKKDKQKFILPPHIDEEIYSDFLAERDGVLEQMESHLLVLEKVKDRETIADLRRIFHTLKGEAAIFELNDVANICHGTEDLIDSSGEELPIDKLLKIKDWLKDVFDALKNNHDMPQLHEQLFHETDAPQGETASAAQTVQHEEAPSQPVETAMSGDIDLLLDFVSEAQEHMDKIDNELLSLESNPEDDETLNAVFRVFHTLKGAAGFLALNDISRLAHITENLLDLARKGNVILSGEKIDVVFESLDLMKKLVANLRQAVSVGKTTYASESTLEATINRIEAITIGKTIEPAEKKTEHAVEEQREQPAEKAPDVKAKEQELQPQQKKAVVKIKESVKVDSETLDQLVDAIGELVIIESMIRQDQAVISAKSSRLNSNIRQMDKITRELQQLGMSLRMIPVKGTFQKMSRVVRDLAKKGDKKIEFTVKGEDTMLDKSVVDKIGDPLIHLVRNSVDHGIEKSTEERKNANKSETGNVILRAFHKGGNIYIEIEDDGRGLNKDAILHKAMEKGLVRDGQALSEREIFNLVFLPGFSTAKKVTDVSGRGVGMDVVRKTLEELRGNIEIVSEPGFGSTFSLRLPLTLAIIDGMLVGVGRERYIVPTLSIVESIRPSREDLNTIANRGEMIQIRDRLIPLFRLSNLFRIEGAKDDPTEGLIIVVEDSGNMTGILVDELLGQQSTVIKSLGDTLKGLPGISGGSIMSDGKVGLILDIAGIVKLATTENSMTFSKT